MSVAGLPKSKKTSLVLQSIQILIAAIANLVLGSYPGFVINMLSVVRNILSQKEKLTTIPKIVLIVLTIVISLCYNDIGVFVIFPLLSFIMFTFFINTKDDKRFKYMVIISNVFWGIHDFYVKAYVAVFFDVISSITNIIGIYRIQKTIKSYERKN
jgi:hypothetical protein